MIAEVLAELEAERGIEDGSIAIIALVETLGGLARAHAIAMAHPRVRALLLGSEDFAVACGVARLGKAYSARSNRSSMPPAPPKPCRWDCWTRSPVLDGATVEALATESRRFGFSGATAVQPDAVPALNRDFAPSEGEIAWVKAVIETMQAAVRDGKGAARLDGKMIDKPVQMQEEHILSRAWEPESGS